MSDNSSVYRSHAFGDFLIEADLRNFRTRPYTPRTTGKAERVI